MRRDTAVSPARILVVDDRPENLLAIEAVLAPLGRSIVSVTSGAEALRRLLREDFAVVLMDVEMPGLDGFETAALIRARPRSATLPILFVTAEAREVGPMLKGYQQGAVDYLVKPIDPDVLRAKVGFFVELHERGERIRLQEREIAERRRAEEANRRAAELERQIVGIVGHDIRGPLSAILATAQVQLRKPGVPAEQRRAFERIERSTERIQQIVGLLLDFTRARVGQGIPLERAPMCLVETARRVVEEFDVVHPDRHVRFTTTEQSLRGEWDGARLAQVLANLLDNAAKYSPADSSIDVTLRAQDGEAVMEVRNDGEVIPPEKLQSLFEPFRRGEDGDGKANTSLGLGLFIVREIVHGHHGHIEVTSDERTGTTFRVFLPRSDGVRDARAPEAARAPQPAPPGLTGW